MPSRHRPTLSPSPASGSVPANLDTVQTQPLSRRRLLAGSVAVRLSPAPGQAASGGQDACRIELGPEGDPDASSPPDAELLHLCAHAHALDAEEVVGNDRRWTEALRRISDLRPTTLLGLHAKTRLALLMLPFGSAQSCPDWANPDEQLIWSLLRDLLALANPDGL